MPTYEYLCESCGNRYEKREGFDALARQKCPVCGKMAQRVLYAPPIVFKGSGFYKTDSRGASSGSNDGGGKSDSADKPEAPATAAAEKPAASTPAASDGKKAPSTGAKTGASTETAAAS